MLLQTTLGMPDHTQLKRQDNTVASMMCKYMQQINKTTQPFPEILLLCYSGEPWTCPGMPNKTQQILQDLTKASIDI